MCVCWLWIVVQVLYGYHSLPVTYHAVGIPFASHVDGIPFAYHVVGIPFAYHVGIPFASGFNWILLVIWECLI